MNQRPISKAISQRNMNPTTENWDRTTNKRLSTQSIQQRKKNSKQDVHWLLIFGVAFLALVVIWILGSAILTWSIQRYNDIRYGSPRTFQIDAVVGHNNDSPLHPSHFIAMNLQGQAVIMEIMASDPSKSVTYVAPVAISGVGAELVPVTVEFRDVNGDGKPDMLMHIHLTNQDQVIVFINTGTKFRPLTKTDQIQI